MSMVWWQTPKYEYRGNFKREMHFEDGEKLCLSVDTSTIPNAGKGLFLTYLGNDNIEEEGEDIREDNNESTTTEDTTTTVSYTKGWSKDDIKAVISALRNFITSEKVNNIFEIYDIISNAIRTKSPRQCYDYLRRVKTKVDRNIKHATTNESITITFNDPDDLKGKRIDSQNS